MSIFNFSTKRVGGLRFVKLGRLTISFSVARDYRALDQETPKRRRRNRRQPHAPLGVVEVPLYR